MGMSYVENFVFKLPMVIWFPQTFHFPPLLLLTIFEQEQISSGCHEMIIK